MLKLKLLIAGVAASAFGVMSADVAQAASYDDPAFKLTIDNPVVVGGNDIHGNVDSDELQCEFTVTFRGQSQTQSGTDFNFTFPTPVVNSKKKVKVTATCDYDDGNVSFGRADQSGGVRPAIYFASTSSTLQAATQTLTRQATVTLLPEGGGGTTGGALPDTGGPDLGLIAAGGAFLVLGVAAVAATRRKRTA